MGRKPIIKMFRFVFQYEPKKGRFAPSLDSIRPLWRKPAVLAVGCRLKMNQRKGAAE